MGEEIRSAAIRVLPFIIILIAIAALIKSKRISGKLFYLNRPASYSKYFIWVAGFLIYAIVADLILYNTGNLNIDKWHHNTPSSVILITGAVILGPIVEELLFRARIFDLMLKWFKNIHWANIAQACIFVSLHHFTYLHTQAANIDTVQSFGDAILYGYARIYTRSIYTSATMHMTGNLMATIERFVF